MTFIPKNWQNGPSSNTLINSASLIDLEQRVAAYADSRAIYLSNYAVGDGVTNDYAALITAFAAAAAANFPIICQSRKTYLCSTRIQVPAGVHIQGNGAWIKGGVSFDSGNRIYNLKFGDVGTWNGFNNNADDIVFENCDAFGGDAAACINFTGGKATNIRYTGGSVSGNVSGGNGVALLDHATTLQHYENIIFEKVHFHHNDRMNFEAIVRGNGVDPVINGYRNINLIDCVFEPTDPRAIGSININVSFDSIMLTDGTGRSGGYSTIKGCTITGGAYCLESAGAIEMLIEDNTFKDSTQHLLSMSQQAYNDACNSRIIGNRFSGTTDVVVSGRGNIFSSNRYNGSGRVRLSNASYTSFTNNNIETTGFEAVMLEHSPYNSITGGNYIRGGVTQSLLFQFTETIDNYIDGNIFYQVGSLYTILNGTIQHFGRNMRIIGGVAYDSEAGGVNTSTPGAVTTINIPHNLGKIPTIYSAQPANLASRGLVYYLTADITNITLNFSAALGAGVSYSWAWTAMAR